MMKTLLAITTYNQLNFTRKCINSLREVNIAGLDIIFIDDVSTDNTGSFLKKNKMKVITRKVPKGLTWSWNIAYRKFKDEGYDNLIISNNDVLFSKKALQMLIKKLAKYTLVCPLSTKRGAGHNWREQSINFYYPKLIARSNRSANYQLIQNKIQQNPRKNICNPIGRFNGFCFGVNRNIIECSFDEDNLFNPKCTNVGQESDLGKRLKEKPHVSLGCFIFHFKGKSFQRPKKGNRKGGKDIRQNLSLYH